MPAFVHITHANIHDSKAMPVIPYEPGAHYVFDHRYNDFSNLYTINLIGTFFVVRAFMRMKVASLSVFEQLLRPSSIFLCDSYFLNCSGHDFLTRLTLVFIFLSASTPSEHHLSDRVPFPLSPG